ncbi:MAG TPA: hypothetical protein VFB35_02010 [Gaiellaceae bacterium]|nr:hypothetical protein [Gaiellaceae bacterium]
MQPKLAIGAALAALLVAVPVALGGSTHASSNTATFIDSIGEDAAAPDITGIAVSNDDAGNITFQINISNRPALTPDMLVLLFLDTDNNTSTGDPDTGGADYVIQLQSGAVGLFQWQNNDFVFATSQTSLTYAYPSTGPTIHVSASDLGRTKAIKFVTLAISGIGTDAAGAPDFTNAHGDAAPDSGHGLYSYQVLTRLILSVTAFTTSPKPAKAGRTFSVSLAATENDTSGPVKAGTVSCAATLARKRIVATTHVLANGVASCIWRIPRTAKGLTIRGTITLTVQGTQVSRPFSARFG